MRMLYMDRRSALVEAIQKQLGEKLEIVSPEAGMHLVALLPPGIKDVRVSQRAAQSGISAMPLSTCYLGKPSKSGLILGYGGTNAAQIQEGVRRLAVSLEPKAGLRRTRLLSS
jgi:GntR family transcriptional regulator / MocR family aminotransferase